MEDTVSVGYKNFTISVYPLYIKFFVALVLGGLVAMQLWQMLNIDVWRQDSLHFVETYTDKLSSEGRWINYFFFDALRWVPPSLSILISYFCLGYFSYVLSNRVVRDAGYSLCFALLVLNIPVLSVQLEWPDTLTIGFALLVAAALSSRKLPDYIFFPLFSCLFFGTFSAFYFLLPLLFIENIAAKSFFRLLGVWIVSFVFGYYLANLVVHIVTGELIQVAGWRQPHPVRTPEDLIQNFMGVSKELGSHIKRYSQIIGWFSVSTALLFMGAVRFLKRDIWLPVTALISALAVYYSTITLGIIVQARSSLTFVMGVLVVVFVIKNMPKEIRVIGLVVMLAVGGNMGVATYTTVSAYARLVSNLLEEIRLAMPYAPESVSGVYVLVNSVDARTAIKQIEKKVAYKSYFSESFKSPGSWLSSFNILGYKSFVFCVDDAIAACGEPLQYVNSLEPVAQQTGLFRSYRYRNDVIFMINK